MNPPASVNSPRYEPSYWGVYLTPCGCMVTAWLRRSSALRKWTTIVSPTSPSSVGPGMPAGPIGSAKPAGERRSNDARQLAGPARLARPADLRPPPLARAGGRDVPVERPGGDPVLALDAAGLRLRRVLGA